MPRSLRVRPEYIEKTKQAVNRNGYISQKDLAEDLGIGLATVNNFLNGKAVDRRYFIDICQRLALDVNEISEFETKGQSLSELEHQTATKPQELHDVQIDVSRFYGRADELKALSHQIVDRQSRVVALAGMSGVGKTALAAKFVQSVVDERELETPSQDPSVFRLIIWRSLRYAPAIVELLAELLVLMMGGTDSSAASTVDGLISQLLIHLRQQRYLIVLDDWENVLQEGELAGYCASEYKGYSRLLKRLAEEHHQSCLLLISREQPIEITPLLGEDTAVGLLKLKGLKTHEAEELMMVKGFTQHQLGLAELIEMHRGNPAALKIAATTIHELFEGNISAFLAQTSLVIGDVLNSRLEQQFERLSSLEKSIMYWLALSGREMSLAELKKQMNATSRSDLVAALESLRRRSLIEKSTSTSTAEPLISASETILFCLEPVVMKYVNQQFIAQICQDISHTLRSQSLEFLGLLSSHPIGIVETSRLNTLQGRLLEQILNRLIADLGGSASFVNAKLQDLLLSLQQEPLPNGFAEANLNQLLQYARDSSSPP